MVSVTSYNNCGCCSGGVDTDCCAGVPATFVGTITNKTGTCTCLPDTVTFTHSGAQTWTSNTFTDCGGESCSWTLECTGAGCVNWVLGALNPDCLDVATLNECDCAPFMIEFLVELGGGGAACSGDAILTITE